MRNEYYMHRSQLKGYLFELVILELLRKNGFHAIDVCHEDIHKVRENKNGFIEFRGKGTWHQIDCPCDYEHTIPFSYPIRLLGEAKYFKLPLDKKYIREFIGILKDIEENYSVPDGMRYCDIPPRNTEIGVYFSANGFQEEAEKLAYSHGIKTISYKNNILILRIKRLIDVLEENYLSVRIVKNGEWNRFRNAFQIAIQNGYDNYLNEFTPYIADGFLQVTHEMYESIYNICTSFFATTASGVFIHFISESPFPEELFTYDDIGFCRVFYNYDNFRNRYFWLEMSEDEQRRRFYFTPPESLNEAALFSKQIVLNEKERIFRFLNVNIKLNGIYRNLLLRIDNDWLNAVRNND